MSISESSGFRFSPETFVDLLHALNAAEYSFLTFGEILDGCMQTRQRTCLLRHDVDISLDYAVEMARIEHDLGVRATYFLMLRSPLYNLMSRHGAVALEEIRALGHEIGLHFDAGFAFRPGSGLEEDVKFELGVLSELTGRAVRAFSFHQPSEEAIRRRLAIPNVINTYSPDQLATYKYISDSNRSWRESNPFELVQMGIPRIQVLLHPIWWMCRRDLVLDCWDDAIRKNFDAAQVQLLATERAYGPARLLDLKRMVGR